LTQQHHTNQLSFNLTERNIYGSSRLGRNSTVVDVYQTPPSSSIPYIAGKRYYELSNHLGNVLSVISDIKYPIEDNGYVDYFEAHLVSISDYSPFGVQLDERTVSSSSYRYGFNGMEKDDEIKGEGNSYDFGARMYDSRVGRWLSRDALESKYPYLSTYNFVSNNPIIAVDPNGKEIIIVTNSGDRIYYKPMMEIPKDADRFTQDAIIGLNLMYSHVPTADKKIDLLTTPTYNVEIHRGLKSQVFGIGGGSIPSIFWNSDMAEQIENEEWQSPLIGLAHEFDHVWRYYSILEGMSEASTVSEQVHWEKLYDDFFDDKIEEKRASSDPNSLEVKTAQTFNQGIRTGYTNPIDVTIVGCVTCITPIPEENKPEEQKSDEKKVKSAIERD
jgi:RHS repeat-associated protein